MIGKFRRFLDEDIHLKELFVKSSSSFLVKILGVFFSFLFTVLVSRQYGSTVYGSFAMSINFLTFSSMLVIVGLDTALLKYTAHYLELKKIQVLRSIIKKILIISVPLGLVVSVLMYFSSELISVHVFKKPALAPYFRISSLMILPWSLAMIFAGGVRGFKDAISFTFIQNASVFLFASISILMLQYIYGLYPYNPVYAYLIAVILTLILSVLIFRRRMTAMKMSTDHAETVSFKQIFTLSIPLLVVVSAQQILAIVNSVMLGIFGSEADVGIYNVALRISSITLIPLMAVNSIAAAKFAEFFALNNLDAIDKMVNISTKIMFGLSLPLFIICLIFPDNIMSLFGREFEGNSNVLRLIIFGQIINVASGSVGFLMLLTNLHKEFRNIILATTVIIITSNYLLLPHYGLMGAALTSMANLMIINLSCVWVVKKRYNIFTFLSPFRYVRKSD